MTVMIIAHNEKLEEHRNRLYKREDIFMAIDIRSHGLLPLMIISFE